MTQGHKRGSRFSADFKAKVLARHLAGESSLAIARDLKMSDKSISNWLVLYRAGKLGVDGKAVVPSERLDKDGNIKPVAKGPRKGSKRGTYKKHGKPAPKRLAAARTDIPAAHRTASADKQRVARLELELAFIKRDRQAFDRAMKALGI